MDDALETSIIRRKIVHAPDYKWLAGIVWNEADRALYWKMSCHSRLFQIRIEVGTCAQNDAIGARQHEITVLTTTWTRRMQLLA